MTALLKYPVALRTSTMVFVLLYFFAATTATTAMRALPFEMRAEIMFLRLEEDLAIIAEKEIRFKAHFEQGEKIWDTLFLDAHGKTMDPAGLRGRDRVYVRGEVVDNTATAYEVRLLE